MLDYINEIPVYMDEHRGRGDYLRLRSDFDASGAGSLTVIASGSSNNATNCARYGMRDGLDKEIFIHTPYTFVNCEKIDRNSFYIVISQSGRSKNTLNVVRMLKEAGVTVHFITDNGELSEDEHMKVYHLDVGNEEVPFVTKGMSATVFFLLRFAGVVFPDNVSETFSEYQKMAEDH
ncbi:MAG: SIS domain-containing protein, partial [Erysipelotrichaceae bacterium]|nr:SIS domain-containing protein [Erysipelotrichaceae bacterium]